MNDTMPEDLVRLLVREALGSIDCDDRQKNKPFRSKNGSKQMAVCAKDGDRERLVRFGDTNSTIKKGNPKRRKSFRARHSCDTAKDKLSARYWSCRAW